MKDGRFGAARGQIRLEVMNLTNTVKVRGPITTLGAVSFGQIRAQAGFMRTLQMSCSVRF